MVSLRRLLLGVVCLIVCGMVLVRSSARLSAAEADARPLTLAILDFKAPDTAPFLGPALSQALMTKLTGVAGLTLLERTEILRLTEAAGMDATADSAQLLGADYLLTGQVLLEGNWPEPSARIRISCRVLGAATAAVQGETPYVVDGTVADWFEMEDKLALWLAAATGRSVSLFQARLRDSRTHAAERLYGLALLCYAQAESRRRAGHFQEAQTLYRQTIDYARQSLGNNGNSFFAGAHSLEQLAREAAALCQEHSGQAAAAQMTRSEAIQQFTKDAAAAAVAFFDLARARQAGGDMSGALTNYEDYLNWAAKNARSFVGRVPSLYGLYGEDAPGWYDNGPAQQDTVGAFTRFVLDRGQVFYLSGADELVCAAADLSKEYWRTPCPGRRWRCLVAEETAVYLVTDDKEVCILDRTNGRLLRTIPIPCQGDDDIYWRILVYPELNRILAVGTEKVYGLAISPEEARGQQVFQASFVALDNMLRPRGYLKWGKQAYFIDSNQNELVQIDPVLGKMTVLRDVPGGTGKDDSGIQKIWPGEDHILLWWRQEKQERFYRYYPLAKKLDEVKQPLLGEAICRTMPATPEQLQVPLMDRRSGRYRLLPAALVLPHTCGADLLENLGNLPEERLPCLRLEGERLWILSRSLLQLINADSGELLWRKRIDGLRTGLEPDGEAALVTTAQGLERHRAIFTLADRMVEQASVRMAECYLALGQMGKALSCVEMALQENGSSPEALVLRGDIAARAGDETKAVRSYEKTLWYASRGTTEYERARQWLKRNVGLSRCAYAGNVTRMEAVNEGVWVALCDGRGESAKFIPAEEDGASAPTLQQPGVWCVAEDRLLGIAAAKAVGELTGQTVKGKTGIYEVIAATKGQNANVRLLAALPDVPSPQAKAAYLPGPRPVLAIYDPPQLSGYAADTGALLWKRPAEKLAAACYDGRTLYVGCLTGAAGSVEVCALNVTDGQRLWNTPLTSKALQEQDRPQLHLSAGKHWLAAALCSTTSAKGNRLWLLRADQGRILRDGDAFEGQDISARLEGLLDDDIIQLGDGTDGSEDFTGNGNWSSHLALDSRLETLPQPSDVSTMRASDLREDDPRRLARLQYLDFLQGCRSREEIAQTITQRLRGAGKAEQRFERQASARILDLMPKRGGGLWNVQQEILPTVIAAPAASAASTARLRKMLTYVAGVPGEATLFYPPSPLPLYRQDLSVAVTGEANELLRLAASNRGPWQGLSLLLPQKDGLPLHPARLALPVGGTVMGIQLHGPRLFLVNRQGYVYSFLWQELRQALRGQVRRQDACFAGTRGALPPLQPIFFRVPVGKPDSLPPVSVNAEPKGSEPLTLQQGEYAGVDFAFFCWMRGVRVYCSSAQPAARLLAEFSQDRENGDITVAAGSGELRAGWNEILFRKPYSGRFWRVFSSGASKAVLSAVVFLPHEFLLPDSAGSATAAEGGQDRNLPGWLHQRTYNGGRDSFRTAECALALTQTAGRCRLDTTGSIRIAQAGEYEITLWAAGETKLELDGIEILPPGGSPGWQARTQRVRLAAGTHPVQMRYVQTGRYRGFLLSCSPPGGLIEDHYLTEGEE